MYCMHVLKELETGWLAQAESSISSKITDFTVDLITLSVNESTFLGGGWGKKGLQVKNIL